MKERVKKIMIKLMWLVVWIVVPTILFLAWDVLILHKTFDQYTATHAFACTLGIIVGLGICKIPGLVRKLCRHIRKRWDKFLDAMMLEDSE